MTPAAKVIGKLGGPQKVARLVKINQSNVYRWQYPRERGGTGGTVPSQYQQKLLNYARRHGIDLDPSDFFETV